MATNIQKLSSEASEDDLTSTPTASTNTAVVQGMNYHTLHFDYTPGASGNVLTITIEGRVNAVTNSAYAQEMEWNESPAGTWTRTLKQYKFTSSGTSKISLVIVFQMHTGEIRIKASETGTNGTYDAWLTSSTS